MANKVAKADLQKALELVEILDKLDSDKNYTLRQVAKLFIERAGNKYTENHIVAVLKVVNDELEFLGQAGEIHNLIDSEKPMCYLYEKQMNADEAEEAICAYSKKHYKRPLEKNNVHRRRVETSSLDDFL